MTSTTQSQQSLGASPVIAARLKQSIVLHNLLRLPEGREVATILLTYTDPNGRKNILAPGTHALEPNATVKLMLLDGKGVIQSATHRCSGARTCRMCVALRDPECYWNALDRECNTNPGGINELIAGEHHGCAESDGEFDHPSPNGSLSPSSQLSSPSEDENSSLIKTDLTKTTEFKEQLDDDVQGVYADNSVQLQGSRGSLQNTTYPQEYGMSFKIMMWVLVITVCVSIALSSLFTWICIRCNCFCRNESLGQQTRTTPPKTRTQCLYCKSEVEEAYHQGDLQVTRVLLGHPYYFGASIEYSEPTKKNVPKTDADFTLQRHIFLPSSCDKRATVRLNNDLCCSYENMYYRDSNATHFAHPLVATKATTTAALQ